MRRAGTHRTCQYASYESFPVPAWFLNCRVTVEARDGDLLITDDSTESRLPGRAPLNLTSEWVLSRGAEYWMRHELAVAGLSDYVATGMGERYLADASGVLRQVVTDAGGDDQVLANVMSQVPTLGTWTALLLPTP